MAWDGEGRRAVELACRCLECRRSQSGGGLGAGRGLGWDPWDQWLLPCGTGGFEPEAGAPTRAGPGSCACAGGCCVFVFIVWLGVLSLRFGHGNTVVQAAGFGRRALGRNPEGPRASRGTSWGMLDLSLLTSSGCWWLFLGVPACGCTRTVCTWRGRTPSLAKL